jgi:hypothetical protein
MAKLDEKRQDHPTTKESPSRTPADRQTQRASADVKKHLLLDMAEPIRDQFLRVGASRQERSVALLKACHAAHREVFRCCYQLQKRTDNNNNGRHLCSQICAQRRMFCVLLLVLIVLCTRWERQLLRVYW